MAILLAQQSGESLLPDPNQLPLTLLITTLLVANQMRADAYDEGGVAFSVTAYCLSNDGRRPLLEIHHLPFPVIGFLRQMNNAKYSRLWQAIVHRAWQRPKESKKGEGQPFEPRYNALYEDLFHLPDRAPQFIRRYFLRRALRRGRDAQDPRTEYSLQQEAEIVSWDIAAIFLGRIMAMEKDRINQIRDMGDRLAQYIVDQNDQRFFRIFRSMRREQYAEFRRAIIRASLESVDRGGMPLVDYDQYIEVFEEEDRLERTDWLLARDLVLIRIIEKLYQLRWLAQNIDGIVESDDLEEENQE